ncbi:MAG: hypothetical protein K6F09_06095 [Clostridiales bacterium]|nr:hypothetical protein [Clostridiales bacterium]
MNKKEDEKLQLHFISNTHWDREWRFSARRTQHMLGYMLDMLLDILDKYPEYRHFHLDSQTMPIQDYLEVYPEKKEKLKKYISEGRIGVGPWFCLPDEFTVGPESLIRNLLLGHKIGSEMGGISKTGYSPFGWGQISQLPQIYAGFDIHFASFYRGINEYMTPRSEFYWQSPDGTRIYASRLGKRPRYNIWYVVQRPVYFDQKNENNRDMKWNDNNGTFKLIDQDSWKLDYQYAHPFFEYHEENIAERADQAVREQDNDWTTPHRFWSDGHDSSCPDGREVRLIKDLDDALPGAHVFHSTLKEMEQGIIDSFSDDAPTLCGEMRYPFTKGSVSGMFGWILSARTYIKQENFFTERRLINYAEPLAVFASLSGAAYPQNFIDLSYNYLLQNHGHDSIGSCGRDIVYEDVMSRYRQSKEISSCVFERAFMDVAGDIDLKSFDRNDAALVLFNPAPFGRSEVTEIRVELPAEWKADSFEILDEDGTALNYQVISVDRSNAQIIQNPNDVANVLHTEQYRIMLDVKDVPAMGYKTYKLRPLYNVRSKTPVTMHKTTHVMENEYLRVVINNNGTFDVTEKRSGKVYSGLGFFKDSGEIGNPWEHVVPECNETFTTLGEKATVTLLYEGELETVYKTVIEWMLPEKRAYDEKSRSEHKLPLRIESLITLRKGAKFVEIETTVDNRCEDHYLQVGFPTGLDADYSYAQSQFDVVKRQIEKLDYSLYDEIPMTENPMNSFVDLTDGKDGVALLNTGLKAFEAADDEMRTMYITLLRAFPLRICVTSDMQDYSSWDKGSQCIGKNTFRYAFMPHEGDWEKGNVWQESEKFNLYLAAAQIAPTSHGKNPLSHSFIELKDENLNVSAVKRSEDKTGWVVRLFNPSDKPLKNAIRLNGGIAPIEDPQSPVERQEAEFELPPYSGKKWSGVSLVSLEEKDIEDLAVNDDGFAEFEITGKKILTIKFKD